MIEIYRHILKFSLFRNYPMVETYLSVIIKIGSIYIIASVYINLYNNMKSVFIKETNKQTNNNDI